MAQQHNDSRFGSHDHESMQVIPAFDEAMVGMKVGGVRRLIVPQELGYPGQPPDFTKQGPTPGSFSVSQQQFQASLLVQVMPVREVLWVIWVCKVQV